MSSKRYSSLLLTALFVSSTAAANAGSKSMLDPYAAIQAPPSKKPATAAARLGQQDTVESTHTTYITMPMPAEEQKATGGKLGGLFGSKKPKVASQPKPEKVAEPKQDKGEGITSKSIASVKNASSGIVDGTKAAGSKIAEGSKAAAGGIAVGAKKVGGGIASGAKASGDYFMKGVHAIGHGFKSTGEKMKDGAGAAGTKVAGLPKLFGGKKDNQEKQKQEAIAKAIAERNAAKQAEQNPALAKDSAKDAEWSDETASNPDAAKPVAAGNPVSSPVQVNQVKTAQAKVYKPKGQNKLAGISGGFGKAFGKLNPFGGKSQQQLPPVRVASPQVIQSTAATPEAVPQ